MTKHNHLHSADGSGHHLHPHHHEQHFMENDFVRDVVIGMSDGLTVPFALAAGLSSAAVDNHIILTAGIAEIIAGSIAMGLGGYLAGKTEVEHYDSELKREYSEIKEFYDVEIKECKDIFASYGLSEESQHKLVMELAKNDDKWVDFMMKFELGLDKPDINRARQSARNIGVAYIVGGIVPLSAYLFTDTPQSGLIFSSIITMLCLMIFGYYKSKVTDQPPLRGAFRTMLIGLLAAGAAFFVARLFST